MKKNFTIYIFILVANALFAQTKSDVAKQQIKDLKEGVLVLNLPTVLDDVTKYRATQSIYVKKDPVYKERVEMIITEKIKENQRLQKDMVKGMDSFYHFSPYVIVYDTAKTIFFDKNIKKIDNYVLPENCFYLSYKTVQVSTELVRNSFVLSDKKERFLENPFPWEIPYRFYKLKIGEKKQVFKYAKWNFLRKRYHWKTNPYLAVPEVLNAVLDDFYSEN